MATRMLSQSIKQCVRPIPTSVCLTVSQFRYPRSIPPYLVGNGASSFSSHPVSWAKKNSAGSRTTNEPSGEKENFDHKAIDKEMSSAVDRLRKNTNLIVNRVGRLTPAYLDSVVVLHHGQRERIDSVAQVIVQDPGTLSVIPYDPSYAKSIEQALYSSSVSLAPKLQSDGSFLLSIPRLTIEVRQTLAKESGQLCEQARAGIRNIRQSGQKSSKKDLDANLITKDDFKANQKILDEVSKTYGKLIDGIESKSKAVLLDKC